MKKSLTFSIIGYMLVTIVGITGCSKKASDPKPTQAAFDVNLLLGTKWTTTGAVIAKTNGTVVTYTSGDPNIGILYLSDVTFLTLPTSTTAGTANESDYGALTWTYNSSSSNLIVMFSSADGNVNGTITKLDAHTLVIHRTNNPDDGGDFTTIDQTLTR